MTKQLKMLVGVALFATLALAGALGIFTLQLRPGPDPDTDTDGHPKLFADDNSGSGRNRDGDHRPGESGG